MRAVASSLITLFAGVACGCGTISNLNGVGDKADVRLERHDPQKEIYGGVKQDADFAATQLHPKAVLSGIAVGPELTMISVTFGLCALVDLPLSLIGDTLTLPITIPATIEKRSTLQHSNTPSLPDEKTTNPTRE